MRKPMAIMIALLALGSATGAAALQGSAGGHCDGDNHVITVGGYCMPDLDGEFTGLVLVREAIGVCRPPVTLPEVPLPFEPVAAPGGYFEYTATAVLPAPADAATYRYTPYAVRAAGGLEPLLANCDADLRSYALVACADLPLARGTIAFDPGSVGTGTLLYRVESCAEDCWTEDVGVYLDGTMLADLAGEPAPGLLGAVVDVYGTRTHCTMPGGDYHTITRIERTVGGGCGAVPAQPQSWGGLKAVYR